MLGWTLTVAGPHSQVPIKTYGEVLVLRSTGSSDDEGSIFTTLFAAPDQVLAPVGAFAGPSEALLEAARGRVFAPMVNAGSVAAAVIDADGAVIAATPTFEAEEAAAGLEPDAVVRALGSDRAISRPVALGRPGAAESAVFTYARAELAGSLLRLFPALAREALPGRVVVLTSIAPAAELLDRAAAQFGLTGLQRRVVATTIRMGSIKAAARRLGIAHDTAREALSQAYRRTGTGRLSELVGRLSGLAFGLLPSDHDPAPLLTDIWGLSPRQAAIGLMIASGVSRDDAARRLGVSPSVARKELEHIFSILQVRTESDLTRTLTGMRGLSALLGAEGGIGASVAEPLRLTPRSDGTLVAWSDYGPPDGKPLLFVHSSMSTRIAPRILVAALQRAGYRPISVDRPGFGMTDPLSGRRAGAHDPFDAAAEDMVALAKAIGLQRFEVVARGGAQFVLALKRRAPFLVGRVVLVNPDPHSGADDRRVGPIGFLKELYQRRPELIRPMAHLLARQLTGDRLRAMFERSVRGSASDERAVADDAIFEDYHRSVRMISTGRLEGYVNEQVALGAGGAPRPLPGLTDWTVLIGDADTLHNPAVVDRYWRRILPDSRFIHVPDAGRFLAMSHPIAVIDALRSQ